MRAALAAGLLVAAASAVAAVACGSSATVAPCAPSTPIAGGGSLQIARADGTTDYALGTVEVEDFLNGAGLAVTADHADGGAGLVAPSDVVAAVHLDPSSDNPGTYDLASLRAEVGFCPTSSMALLIDGGAITGCRDDANPTAPPVPPTIEPLSGTLKVQSSQNKDLEAPRTAGGHASLVARYGTGTQACAPSN